MSIKNLKESFLYNLLPSAVLSQDELGLIQALVSGYQDRLGDLRSYASKLDQFWVPGGLPDGSINVVLVDVEGEFGKTYTSSLDIKSDTPSATSNRLTAWVAGQLGIAEDNLSNIRYGYDPLRAVDVNTLSWLAATLGTLLYQTTLLPNSSDVNAAQIQLVSTWFPRLKIKGTAQSFDVIGRTLGFDDVKLTPLWTRLSPRVPDDIGDPSNDPDFSASPEYFPRQDIGPFYNPFDYRDGPFYAWSGTASNGTSSTSFYTETISGHNPWVNVVLLGSLAGTNIPAISDGVVIHPSAGSYALAGGSPYVKAYVDCLGSSIRFRAIADGDSFNGLYVHVSTYGTLAVIDIQDRLSSIKYRSSYFDLGLTAQMDKVENIFGSRAATTNVDLKDNPALTSDGTAVSPYRPWADGSIAVEQTNTDWITLDGATTSTVSVRREANPAAPYRDRQLNFDQLTSAGIQVTQAFEEVRAATRLPRKSQAGFLIDNEVCYAPYTNSADLFVTSSGTTFYSGSSSSSPLPSYVANIEALLPNSFYASWLGYAGQYYVVSASYNSATAVTIGTVSSSITDQVVFYDPSSGTSAVYTVTTPGPVAVGSVAYGTVSGGIIPAKAEINPLNQNEYLYSITDDRTTYELSGSYNFSTGSYGFSVLDYGTVTVRANWVVTSTEAIRPEPSYEVKSTGTEGQESNWEFTCLERPEDDDNGLIYDTSDDYPWLREVLIGGELVDLDIYQSGTELGIQVVDESTAFNDQTGCDVNVYGITSKNTPHPRVTYEYRSIVPGIYSPGHLAIGYSGTIKSLSSLTSDQTELVRQPVGSSVGDTETDYDVLFESGYGLYHVGLAQGVLVADLPKFMGAHHSVGLTGWFAFDEHLDDNLTVIDHSNKATPTVLSGLSYASRVFDSERGWHLNLSESQVVADEYRDVEDEITLSFWIKLASAPASTVTLVDNLILYFDMTSGGTIRGYAKNADGTYTNIGLKTLTADTWYFVYIRRSATSASFRARTLTVSEVEVTVAGDYIQGDPDTDTPLYVQAYSGASYGINDLRIWNVHKTSDEMDLVRYHLPTATLCLYRLGFIYTLDKEDKFGIKILPSGWAYPDVLPAWLTRTRLGYVLRYDSMGSYVGQTRFKEVGIGDQHTVPDTYLLGQQFVTMTAEGTAPFSTDHGQLPGWNPLWQATSYDGNYDVLPFSGSTSSGIVPVSTASGTTTPWPNTQTQTNPFRHYVYVNTTQGTAVYQLSLEGDQTSTWLLASPVVHGRIEAEAIADPYISELVANGTVYTAFGTGFIQGTLVSDTGTYGFYDPISTTYYPKTFNVSDLYVSDMPTGAYVLLSGSGSGVLMAYTGTDRGDAGYYGGTVSTPPLYMYTNSRIVASAADANDTWTDNGVATPLSNDVDVTAMPELVTVTAYGTFLNTPALGKAGVLEFNNNGVLEPGPYELTVVSGQVGQADIDFSGFAVDIDVNDTVIQRRLLKRSGGYNFSGTDTFQIDLNDGVSGDYLISFDWTNPAEDASKGTKRQLALFSYALRHITTELFKVTILPSTQVEISALATDSFNSGTTPGGWFSSVNSYGTNVGYEHESDIYTSNDTVDSIYPLGDTLTGLTNERRNDLIYVGTNVVISNSGSFVFPSFGSLIAT